ncbi:hypothetical protein HZS61_016646 [Fusarium oxysporum f. sp. conglutinans]|uniref:Secreted protein n=1 Tax=Fusarium oxysporum f. sp. conglutinans TaxID=100902 RepID=A0A8H6GKS0_FUSOX|nr:hypothetical protein HZS61_016646 [Fusarium oxysporum f. sp. conglutinans]
MKTIKFGVFLLCRCSISCLSSPSQLYICHSNALYAELPTATETLQPSQTPRRLKQRAVPSEMITCGYKMATQQL